MDKCHIFKHAQPGRGTVEQKFLGLRARAKCYQNVSRRTFVTFNGIATEARPFSSTGIRQPEHGKHFLHIDDWSKDELWETLQTARKVKAILKSGDESYKPLKGKTLAMIFTKPSMRTRVSFETVSAAPRMLCNHKRTVSLFN
jgi:Aspartate/ornithine carbamoyltransferase, carbamoyl-P binding domain